MKPALYNISAFDATKEKTITFNWSGNQAFKNECIIRNNTTNTIVYQNTQETLQLKHDIRADALNNGVLYNITIKVIDKNNNISEESTPVLFYCYSTPLLSFSNVSENQIIQNSSYQINLSYNQTEGEQLQYFQVLLYSMNKNLIWSSGVKYDTSTLSVTISDLDDNGTYFLRATGYTINGMELDTGYMNFSVDYELPSMYSIVTLENKAEEGMIKIQSNIISLEGKYYGEEPIPYEDDEYISLYDKNYVSFDEGFSLNNNFTINFKGKNFSYGKNILAITDGEKTINITHRKGIFLSENNIEKAYFELEVESAFSPYKINSNYYDIPDEAQLISVWIRRQSHVYDICVNIISN